MSDAIRDASGRSVNFALDTVFGKPGASAAPARTGAEIERRADGISDVLAQHRLLFKAMTLDNDVPCSCGTRLEWPQAMAPRAVHDRHVARKIAEWLAEKN